MNIIQRYPNPSGAYPAPQTWATPNIPTTHVQIADSVDMTDFYIYNGFVILTIEDNIVTAYTPNVEAWEEWKNSLPKPKEEPTQEERIEILEEQVAQADEVMISMFESQALLEEQLALTDETAIQLFEAQAMQEEINTAQDDALIEIYEMIGGLQ